MLFGSYAISESKDRHPRLSLKFKKREINFYACSVQFIHQPPDEIYDWSADVPRAMPGMRGPRTLQSLTLVSEVVHGTPSRFRDPARFSFAHGGKDGYPFPVPTQTYDEVIETLQKALQASKLGLSEKAEALKKLHQIAARTEKDFIPSDNLQAVIEKEWAESWKYGGRTVFGKAKPPKKTKGVQLRLF